MHEMTLLLLLAFVVGILGGLIGIGGAVFLLPVLVYWLAWPETVAQGTTLAMLLPPVSLLAVIQYYRMGEIRLKPALVIAVSFVPGAYVGGLLGNLLPAAALTKIFGAFAVLVALKLLWTPDRPGSSPPPSPTSSA